MKLKILAAAILLAATAAPHALYAKSKAEIRTETKSVVDSHRREAVLIYNWLKHTPELSIHRMRGATQNKVYTLAPGHREAVYDAAGNLVQDDINNGSYNHFPWGDPANHFAYDTLPWFVWGYSKKDPTSQPERVAAYVEDLGRGLTAMQKAPNETVDLDRLKPHEVVVLAMFIGAIEDGGAETIYGYLGDPKRELLPADGAVLARQLEMGLSKQLKDYKDLMALTPPPPKPAK